MRFGLVAASAILLFGLHTAVSSISQARNYDPEETGNFQMAQSLTGAPASSAIPEPAPAPAPAPAEDFGTPLTGLYIGGFAGAAFLNTTLVTPAFNYHPPGLPPMLANYTIPVGPMRFPNQGGSGFVGGFRVGWGMRVFGDGYLGVEGEMSLPQNARTSLTLYGISYRGRLETEGAAFIRVGWMPTPRLMLFSRAGISIPRQVVQVARSTVERWSPTPAVGAGAEYMVTRRVGLRADVTYMPAQQNNQIGSLRATIGLSFHF